MPELRSRAVALVLLSAAIAPLGCRSAPTDIPVDRTPTAAVSPTTISEVSSDPTRAATAARAVGHLRAAEPVPTLPPALAQLALEPPTRDLRELATRMGRSRGPVPAQREGPPLERAVGQQDRFWVHDINNNRFFEITATLRVITDRSYFWVQNEQSFDRAQLERGARIFSERVYPRLRDVFGQEWSPGVDRDPRLHVLHHQPVPGIAGYYSSADEFTTAVDPHSNEREMFYINLSVYRPGSYDYLALLAHELQHMIHWNADRDEPVWSNEGLSELAALIAGYPSQSGQAFLVRPDTPLLEWQPTSSANGPHYAATFLYFAYLYAQHGEGLLGEIVAAERNGPTGIEAALAALDEPATFEQTFLDWAAANRLVDAARADGRYGYGDIVDIQPVYAEVPSGELTGLRVGQFATDYYDLTGQVEDGRLALTFRGDPTVGLLELVPAETDAVWWSNRGDGLDSHLTHTFDLSDVERAELRLRMWYALEEHWDYAYFLVSTDNGRTWQPIETKRTTDANPNGGNYGTGLTGRSDGWVEETLDLTPYTGGPVTVRLEVITDDAVNLTGLAVDDVRLDAIGFTDDAETDRGWQAEGWLRLSPALPQRWGLQLIVDSETGLEVTRLPVAPDGTANIVRDRIPDDASVTLTVSGLTPATRNPAGYGLVLGE